MKTYNKKLNLLDAKEFKKSESIKWKHMIHNIIISTKPDGSVDVFTNVTYGTETYTMGYKCFNRTK